MRGGREEGDRWEEREGWDEGRLRMREGDKMMGGRSREQTGWWGTRPDSDTASFGQKETELLGE
jgi:hypothetical protein